MLPSMPTGQATNPPAIVLLSGGLDSATTLAIARDRGLACHAISFDYGQRHRVELDAARAVAEHLGTASHTVVTLDLRQFGGSALTANIDVPKDRPLDQLDTHIPPSPDHHRPNREDIPVTYVPARNTIFLSYALALAEVREARDIFLGVNAVDYSGYPDCRPEYLDAFQRMANLATRAGVTALHADTPADYTTIHAPLIDLPKIDIIRRGLDLGVDYRLTHSCYDPVPLDATTPAHPLGVRPCAHCDSCLLRQRAFEALGTTDPLIAE